MNFFKIFLTLLFLVFSSASFADNHSETENQAVSEIAQEIQEDEDVPLNDPFAGNEGTGGSLDASIPVEEQEDVMSLYNFKLAGLISGKDNSYISLVNNSGEVLTLTLGQFLGKIKLTASIKDYKDLLFSDSNMPIDVLIEPEQAVTDYVRKLVEQPGALQVLDFADGVIRMIGMRATKNSPLVDQKLKTLREHIPKADARVAAIYRKNKAIVPSGDTVIEDGDEVFFIAAKKNIKKVMSELRKAERPYKRIIIAGGGNIGYRLASALEDSLNVKIIAVSYTHLTLPTKRIV